MLSCPVVGSKIQSLKQFTNNAKALGIDLPSFDYVKPDELRSELILNNTVLSLSTDVEGKFILPRKSSTSFLIYSRYKRNNIDVEWLIQVKGDENVLDLNNNNIWKYQNTDILSKTRKTSTAY